MASWNFPGIFSGSHGNVLTASKAASYTVVPGDKGTLFFATAAATFTLPAIANVQTGWNARFYNSADTAMTVTAPAGKLICFNNAAATSIAFSTTAEMIGNCVEIIFDGAKYNAMVYLAAETATPTIA